MHGDDGFLLFKCPSHIQKSGCGGVVAIPCHAPAGQSGDFLANVKLHRVALWRKRKALPLHLRVVLICRALLSILAPMSSMLFPLRSTFLRQVLLPRALTRMVPRERSRESVRDKDCRAWRRQASRKKKTKQRNVKLALKTRKHLVSNPVASVSNCLVALHRRWSIESTPW